ncbi:MAG: hypothetical protein AAGA90_18880 [Actinomycetota bacterium]
MSEPHDPNPLDALRRSVAETERLDPATADRIESRLRVAHAASRSRPTARWWRPAIAAPALLVLVVALSVGVLLRGSDPAAALVVTDADNVTVRLPDGTLVVDPEDGYRLPDGAVVEIGVGGMVTVDDVVLDSAAVLEVRDGRLVADVVATTTTPVRPDHLAPEPTTTEPPDEVVTTTTLPPTTTTAAPATTAAPERSETTTTTAPADDRGRDDDGDGDGDREGDDGRGGREERNRDDGEDIDVGPTVSIALDLVRSDRGVELQWNVDGLQPGWSVVIVRRIGDGDPTTVVSTTDEVGGVTDAPTRDDGRPVDRRLRYRLIVLDEAGGEVASGPSQSLR